MNISVFKRRSFCLVLAVLLLSGGCGRGKALHVTPPEIPQVPAQTAEAEEDEAAEP